MSHRSDLPRSEGPRRHRSQNLYRVFRLRHAMSLQRDLDVSARWKTTGFANPDYAPAEFVWLERARSNSGHSRRRRPGGDKVQPLREHATESTWCFAACLFM